jgi:hypothetical protein
MRQNKGEKNMNMAKIDNSEKNAMNGIRKMAECVSSSGAYAVVSGKSVLAIHLHRERAEEWSSYYKGAKVVTMGKALAMSRAE